ncbi:MAG TPA: hypothetical protein VHL79_03800 [Ramlibacter sp.]|jgi:hypothetical protein|nr:hypothetical protein [Ramlibacter sp.]
MRTRTILLVVAILLTAGFAALNWGEITRVSPLLFGPVVADAPLGAILLGLLGITLILFLASTAAMRTQSLMDYRHHVKELEAQRALADKAEASRFNELRAHLDEHLGRMGDRDTMATAEFDKAMAQNRREMQAQMEQMNRMLAARLNELEHRLETRFERMGMGGGRVATPVTPVVHDEVRPSAPVHEHAMAQQATHDANVAREARDAQLREEERRRDERANANATTGDRPAETGWRRWF